MAYRNIRTTEMLPFPSKNDLTPCACRQVHQHTLFQGTVFPMRSTLRTIFAATMN